MKGSAAVTITIVIFLFVVIGMLGYILFVMPPTTNINPAVNSTNAMPTIPVKDFAPNIPMSQKTTIIIMSNDSSEEKYIVPVNQVDTYVKQLPPGFHVVSKTP